ncbi:hypothetical protein Pmani_012004 [Petrolisthes manimaculis]|uniref:Uncharacterized protein n=1 Tax=Petrolisthes manimaculis TaxID=1843537 RepID=A0AAE1PYU2_9EUCA|nr:hypothetical protein Pmani_012004 [Petrolisthes manimaculis]
MVTESIIHQSPPTFHHPILPSTIPFHHHPSSLPSPSTTTPFHLPPSTTTPFHLPPSTTTLPPFHPYSPPPFLPSIPFHHSSLLPPFSLPPFLPSTIPFHHHPSTLHSLTPLQCIHSHTTR